MPLMRPARSPQSSVVLGLVITLTALVQPQQPASAQVGANMKDQLIYRYCSRAMAGDFSKANRTPPSGMIRDTCTCVVEQIGARASIAQARSTCQARALQNYPLQEQR